jgi:hypothetical protein
MQIRHLSCFRHLSWHPSPKALREFGIAMLCGFAVLGLITLARSHAFTPAVAIVWTLGAMLAVLSRFPGPGRIAYLAVNLPTSAFGYLVSRVALVLVFFLVFLPIGRILKWMGKDLLQLKPARSTWVPVEDQADASNYSHQF